MPAIARGTWCVVRGAFVIALISGSASARLSAQTEAIVNRLAPILAAEDARDFQGGLLGDALVDPDTLVRRTAIRALGRIGDGRAVALLLPVLSLPDTADLHAETAFALGILRDSSAVGGLIAWLRGSRPERSTAVDEGILALTRIGGPEAAAYIAEAIRDPRTISVGPDPVPAVREAWRLGRLAPTGALLSAAGDFVTRAPAIYGLSRLHPKEAGALFLESARSPEAGIRQDAIRPLSKNYSRDAGLAATAVTSILRNALGDTDPGVRINALRALGTWADPAFTVDVLPLLNDHVVNVQITAVTTLGQLGGRAATDALNKLLAARRPWPLRREALLALARTDTAALRAALPGWVASSDWRDRAVAAEALNLATPGTFGGALSDPDPRVVNTALQAWGTAVTGPDPALLSAARTRLGSPDAMIRATSAEILARAADGRDASPLGEAWRKAAHDSFPDAAQSALGALHAIAQGPDSSAVRGFLAGTPAPTDPLLRGWAEANWPELAEHWGPSRPIQTGRSIEDYRALARQYLVPIDSTRNPRVTLEVADRGSMVIELFGSDAPLTVANFLRLVDRGYFDGIRFHRVVPNFVIQAGDPRGDGNGGPGWSIRDEINRKRYGFYTLGMALSGPDTGGSQWFITLAAEPHLDGGYTVFGQLHGGEATAAKVVQGDQIRRIHR